MQDMRASKTPSPVSAHKRKFPPLLLVGEERALHSAKERLERFLFRNGYFDIYDSALGLPGLKSRYQTTVSTPEDLSQLGRKKVVFALQEMVDTGEITLRELIDLRFIKPEAPIGYWGVKENARFWVDQMLYSKMELLDLAEGEKAAVALAKEGAFPASMRDDQCFREAQRKAICALTTNDFIACGLDGLLQKPYKGKIHLLVSDLYPDLGVRPWELSSTPKKFFQKKENRIAAIRWVAHMLRKRPEEYSKEERRVADLRRKDLEMMTLEDWRIWNRLTEKDPLALTTDDLKRFRIAKILDHAEGEHKLAQLVCEAYPNRNYRVWQMKYGIKRYFAHPVLGRERRVEAVKYAAAFLKKQIWELTYDDINAQSYQILRSYPVNAVIFAMWEADNSITPQRLKNKPLERTIRIFEEWKAKQAA